MQSINYNGIIAGLIKEVQTLRAKINELNLKFSDLKINT